MGQEGPPDARGRPSSGTHRERQSTGRRRGGPARSSDEGPVIGLEPRVPGRSGRLEANPQGKEPTGGPKRKVRSFEIPERLVAEAWERVRANDGAPARRGGHAHGARPKPKRRGWRRDWVLPLHTRPFWEPPPPPPRRSFKPVEQAAVGLRNLDP